MDEYMDMNTVKPSHPQGLFATRTPHRPNLIGLSLCRLVQVLFDRTP